MLAHQAGQGSNGLLLFPFIEGGVDYAGSQHLAGGIHHSNLAAVAVSRVQAHGDKTLHRRLHQQGLEIQGKIMNGTLAGSVGELVANFPLDGGKNQPLKSILRGGADKSGNGHNRLQRGTTDNGSAFVAGQGNGGLQDALLFAPVDGKNLVIQNAGNGLREIIVKFIDAVFFCSVFCFAGQKSFAHDYFPQPLSDVSIVGEVFCDNIIGTLESFLGGINSLIRVYIPFCQHRGVLAVLRENRFSQRRQTFFSGHGATGTPLLLVRAIKVFHFGHGLCLINGGGQLLREFSLVIDGLFHFFPPSLQIAQIGQTGFQITKGGIIHGTVHFLTVARDERNGISFINQLDDIFNIFLFLFQLLRQNFGN